MSAFDIHYCFAGKDVDLKGKKENYKSVHAKVELKGRQFFRNFLTVNLNLLLSVRKFSQGCWGMIIEHPVLTT